MRGDHFILILDQYLPGLLSIRGLLDVSPVWAQAQIERVPLLEQLKAWREWVMMDSTFLGLEVAILYRVLIYRCHSISQERLPIVLCGAGVRKRSYRRAEANLLTNRSTAVTRRRENEKEDRRSLLAIHGSPFIFVTGADVWLSGSTRYLIYSFEGRLSPRSPFTAGSPLLHQSKPGFGAVPPVSLAWYV